MWNVWPTSSEALPILGKKCWKLKKISSWTRNLAVKQGTLEGKHGASIKIVRNGETESYGVSIKIVRSMPSLDQWFLM